MRKRIMSIRDGRLGLVWMGHALGQGQHLLPEQHLYREPVLARTPRQDTTRVTAHRIIRRGPRIRATDPRRTRQCGHPRIPRLRLGRQSRCIRLSRRLEEEDHRVQEVVADHCPPRGPRRSLGPTPAVPMPAQKDSRGYGMGRSGSKIGAFSPSPSDAEIRAWGTRSQLRDLRPRRSLQLPPGRHGLAPAPRKNYTRSER